MMSRYVYDDPHADLDLEVVRGMVLSGAVHYERNNWTSGIVGDERENAHEDIVQGEILLIRQFTDSLRGFVGFQRSNRKQSFEPGVGEKYQCRDPASR